MRTFSRRVGFSFVEVLIATVILGTALVAAMSMMGTVAKSQKITMDRRLATELAYSFLEEILTYPYDSQSPQQASFVIKDGNGDGNLSVASPIYSTVDDFDGSDCQPPCETDGSTLTSLLNVRRTVSVELVSADSLDTTSVTDEGVKRITVVVEVDGKELARTVGLKTDHD